MKLTRKQLSTIINEALSGNINANVFHVLVPMGVEKENSLALQDAISSLVAKSLGAHNELNRENIGAYIDEHDIDIDQPDTAALSKAFVNVSLIHSKLSVLPGGEGMSITLRRFMNGVQIGVVKGKLSGIKKGKIKGSIEHKSDQELKALVKELIG